MKRFAAILGMIVFGVSSGTSYADGIGLPVTGILTTSGTTNYFDSANNAVPAGYGNSSTNGTVVIGSGIEFGATNGQDLFTADFSGTSLTIMDTCVSAGCGSTPFTVKFYSPNITGYTVSSINFPFITYGFGFDPTFGGNAGFLTFAGSGKSTFTGGMAVFDYTSTSPVNPVPEPGTLGLMATGLLGVVGVIRRRFNA